MPPAPHSEMHMQCTICGQKIDSEPLVKHKGYKLYHCKMCEVMFWDPMKGLEAESYDADDIAAALSSLKLTTVSWRHSRFLHDAPARGGESSSKSAAAQESSSSWHKTPVIL